jgi:hypothetical protein
MGIFSRQQIGATSRLRVYVFWRVFAARANITINGMTTARAPRAGNAAIAHCFSCAGLSPRIEPAGRGVAGLSRWQRALPLLRGCGSAAYRRIATIAACAATCACAPGQT